MRISLCFLIAGFAAMIPATATSAEPDDFLACREVASDEARLQCYDAIADRAAPETAEQEAAPVSETVAPEAVAATPPVSETVAPEAAAATLPATSTDLFGRTGEELTEIIADAMGFEMVDEINARVAEARLDQYKRFVIVLDNQQRWRQTGGNRFRIDAGDEVVIARAALGSFTLRKRSGGPKVKVRRID